jgi:hypothetical protein
MERLVSKELKMTCLAAIIIIVIFSLTGSGFAATYDVDRTDDNNTNPAALCTPAPNDCSLRGAIIRSNINSGDDIINVPANTYTLTITSGPSDETFGDLDVDDDSPGNLTINGVSAQNTIIQAGTSLNNGIDRVLQLHRNQLNLNNVTIRYGTVNGIGGGIHNDANMIINNCTIDRNTAQAFNGLAPDGGGIYNGDFQTLTITNSTISNNRADQDGGGIFNNGGTVNLTNVTISGNQSDLGPEPNASGGGIYNASPGTINMTNVTIANNIAHDSQGDGIYNNGTANLVNTLIANNDNQNCAGNSLNANYSLSSDSSCAFSGSNNLTNTGDPGIGPLAYNGGPTQTHRLFIDSPAVDTGTDSVISPADTMDQRGFTRPVDILDRGNEGTFITDRGAFELQQNEIPTLNQWGMIIFVIFAGLGAVFYLRRQKTAKS